VSSALVSAHKKPAVSRSAKKKRKYTVTVFLVDQNTFDPLSDHHNGAALIGHDIERCQKE